MAESIISSLITGGLALIGVVVSNMAAASKTETAMRISQAVTDTKLTALTEEVRKHNGFAQKIPVMENQIHDLYHDMEELKKLINK